MDRGFNRTTASNRILVRDTRRDGTILLCQHNVGENGRKVPKQVQSEAPLRSDRWVLVILMRNLNGSPASRLTVSLIDIR